MIKKERLKELIEQGTQVWKIYKDTCQGIYQVPAGLFGIGFSSQVDETTPFNELFETIEEAEWYKEFGCIERTERLELPTWEQIENIIEQKKKFGLNHSDRVLARIITNDSIYYFKLCKDLDLFTFELKQTYIGEDLCEQLTSRFPVSLGKATKSNYEKACRKCKELFLGGSDGDIQ